MAQEIAREETAGPAAGVAWDLSDLYTAPDDPTLERDLDDAFAEAEALASELRGRVGSLTASELASALDRLEALEEKVGRAGSYAGLLFAADTTPPEHGALYQKVQERGSAIRNELLFLELEWVALADDVVDALLAEPVLEKRRHHLRSMRRYRPHLRSEAEEKILEQTANTGRRAFSRLFDEVMSAARFRLEGPEGERELSEEEVLSLLYDADRETRRRAALSLTEGLHENERVLAFIFNTLVQDKAQSDRLRAYANPIDDRNLANEIEGESVRALLDACDDRYELVHRYYRLKAELLGLSQLEDYDRYAPLPAANRDFRFDEAREIVISAYRAFSPNMAEIADRFFESNWIDAELRPGKRGGAFSASTIPSVHPYVLLNYTGNMRDVMTVAHELGHGVHQYLAREQGLFGQDTPLTTAETASVFGEMLVFRRLMEQEDDPEARLALLCGKLEDAFATVFRQVAMTRFEQSLHRARREEGELAVTRINELWMAANEPMFGDSVHLGEHYACWWLYIPHFVHSPFYCYAYAYGELLVLALLQRYDALGDVFVPRYLELLRAGGSDKPETLLSRVGLDITEQSFWRGGLDLLENLLDQAETLAAELRGAGQRS